jgi:hypothetical protein
MGTINMETDSVRKYTDDKYTHAKVRHSRTKAKGQEKGTPKGKPSGKLPVIDESQEESLEESD